MGKVIVNQVLLKNHRDEIAVDLKALTDNQIREVRLDMIADTGAMHVSLPQRIVEQLGLPFEKTVRVRSFNGRGETINMYGDLVVYIDDRRAIVPCIGIPENQESTAPCLLGQMVFEQIDYVVDCKAQKVLPNPTSDPGMMTFEMYSYDELFHRNCLATD